MRKSVIAFIIIVLLIPVMLTVTKKPFSPQEEKFTSSEQKSPLAISNSSPSPEKEKVTPSKQNSFSPTVSKSSPKYSVIDGLQILPVDEGSKDSSFNKFRQELLIATKNKDINFLKQHIDDKIEFSFGDDPGITGFMEEWQLEKDPGGSKLWSELEKILKLGGSFGNTNVFSAPYVFSECPDSVDAFVYVAVIDKNVKLFSKPNEKSQVIGLLNYNIVQVIELDSEKPWNRILVQNNREGYVQTKYIRSPIDYRACFENKNGTWKIVCFIAGD